MLSTVSRRMNAATRFSSSPLTPYKGPYLHLPLHPGAPDPDNLPAVRQWVRAQSRPTAIDVFSGAGGLSLGLRNSGFSVLVGADSDPCAIETHLANLGGLGYTGDLSDARRFLEQLKSWGINRVDLVAAGLPCQPFSRAGRSKIRSLIEDGIRDEDDPRIKMWRSFTKIVKALRPRAVLLENVPDLAVWDEGGIVIALCEALQKLGYTTQAKILNAYDHGVPQHRARLFLVGLRAGASFVWPKPRGNPPDLRAAIGDLPRVPRAQRRDRLPYDGPQNPFQRKLRTGVVAADRDSITDHITRDVRPDDAEAFALLRQGDTYADLPNRLRRYTAAGFKDKYKRLSWNALSRSITAHIAKDGYWYIHPSQKRTLSVREAARIQTFPDWFRFAGHPSTRLRQIGNAVPPLLGEAIGRRVLEGLDGDSSLRTAKPGVPPRRKLIRWHSKNKRVFPWRQRATPWQVLMAEMCLRRTRADQVVPVYRQLVKLARTPSDMVANRALVRKAMKSLGLRWRADNMIALAKHLVRRQGRVPDSEADLLQLPGVGDYVSGALRTFGFRGRAVLIDTNTTRITQRIFGRRKLSRWQLRLDLYQLAGKEGPDAAFNYALLDLGALICRSRTPLCERCPLRGDCQFAITRGRS